MYNIHVHVQLYMYSRSGLFEAYCNVYCDHYTDYYYFVCIIVTHLFFRQDIFQVKDLLILKY